MFYYLRVVDSHYREMHTLMYNLALVDTKGKLRWIEALGIDTITDTGPPANMEEARIAFPDASESAFIRPVGPVDILIGMNERDLHSKERREVQKLRLSDTPLGGVRFSLALFRTRGQPLMSSQWGSKPSTMQYLDGQKWVKCSFFHEILTQFLTSMKLRTLAVHHPQCAHRVVDVMLALFDIAP